MESECVRDLVQPEDGQEDCQARAGGEKEGQQYCQAEAGGEKEDGQRKRRIEDAKPFYSLCSSFVPLLATGEIHSFRLFNIIVSLMVIFITLTFVQSMVLWIIW